MRSRWVGSLLVALMVGCSPSAAAAQPVALVVGGGGGSGWVGFSGVASATAVGPAEPSASPGPAPAPAVSQAQALAAVDGLFPQAAQLPAPEGQTRPDPFSGHTLWQFSWQVLQAGGLPPPPASAAVDGQTGRVVQATFPPSGPPRANPMTLQAASAAAQAFLAHAMPGKDHLLAQGPQVAFQGAFGPGARSAIVYTFRWLPTVDGVPVRGAGVSVTVDASTGQVTGFYRTVLPDVRFPPLSGALPADAEAAAALKRVGLVLAYDAPDRGPFLGAPPEEPATLRPMWELATADGLWDAETAGPLPGSEVLPTGSPSGPLPAQLTLEPSTAPGSASGPPPTPLSSQQARAVAERILTLGGYTGWTYQGTGQGQQGGPGGAVESFWSVQFQPPGSSGAGEPGPGGGPGLSVEIDQASGRLIGLFVPPFPEFGAAGAASASAAAGSAAPPAASGASRAAEAASAFLQAVDPGDAAQVSQPSAAVQPGVRGWAVRFVRLYRGLPVATDSIEVTVGAGGRIAGYQRTWHHLVPGGGSVTPLAGAAAAKAFAALPVTPVYTLQYPPGQPGGPAGGRLPLPVPRLAYAFHDARNLLGPVRLDAAAVAAGLSVCGPQGPSLGHPCLGPQGVTLFRDAAGGEVLHFPAFYASDGEPLDTPPGPPAAIRGSWAMTPLWALEEAHLLPAGARPDAPAAFGPALAAVMGTLGQRGGFGYASAPLVPAAGGGPAGSRAPAAAAVLAGPYGQTIAAAKAAGVLPAGSAVAANPEAAVSRQEAVGWVVRALGYGPLLSMSNRVDVRFADAASVAPGLANAVGIAQGLGILAGGPGTDVRPRDPVTWAELATMLMRAMGHGTG